MSDLPAPAPVLIANQREVFVGPRPFERSEKNLFFGRDGEIEELLSLVTSHRIVLCYAPSGAGKTSLINAGLHPQLETEGFEVLPPTRVRGLIPEGVDESAIPNIYVFNVILGLARDTASPYELTSQTISGYLAPLPHLTDQDDFQSLRILILDQFEELITAYLERWQEREGFFKQVGDALRADPLLRVLFVMREDYLARVEPFIRGLKTLSQARFRLDLLGPNGAKAAVVGPLRDTQRYFKDGVVDTLIEELLKVRVESTQGEAADVIGEYVEPVQLQVVCRNLWNGLPPNVQEISHEHVKAYGDVDQALRDFYESCLTGAKTDLRTNEADLRHWFERQLITPAGTRSIVFRDAQLTAGLSNAVVDFLENKHIIRGEWRAGSRWYELTHDRLIEPIQRANESWRRKRQASTTSLLTFVGGIATMVLILLAAFLSFQRGTSYAAPADANAINTAAAATNVIENATSVGLAQATTVAIRSTSEAVQADATLSKSRQLAAEALLASDRNLSLLLAIQANNSFDTAEARRSLHKVLSRRSYSDGSFLRELRLGQITPTIVQRLSDHQAPVVSVAFGPDGKQFVSGSVNGTVLLWNVSTLEPISPSLTTRRNGITSVAYSPDGLLVASTGQDLQISLWNAITGEPVGEPLSGIEGLITCLAFSPDGKLLASGGLDHHIYIWDTTTGTLLGEPLKNEHNIASLAWSPDGRILAAGTYGPSVIFWTNEDGFFDQPQEPLSGLSNTVRSIAWSPDGQLLALGLGSNDNAPSSGDVILWNYEERAPVTYSSAEPGYQMKATLYHSVSAVSSNAYDEGPLPDNTSRVRTVAFDPTGRILGVGRDDGTIAFVDVSKGQLIGSPLTAHGHSSVTSIAFSPDGRYFVSASLDRTVALWSLSAPTSNVAVSETGNLLATSHGSIISVWDLSSGATEPSRFFSGHTDNILALAFSPDGKTLVSSGEDNLILFWDVDAGLQLDVRIRTQSNVHALRISPDGKLLVQGGDSGRTQLSDPPTDPSPDPLVEIDGPVLQIQFTGEGKTLHVVGSNGSITTFDLQTTAPILVEESVLPSAQGGLTSVALSPDGKRAAYFRIGGTGETAVLSNDGRAHGIELSVLNQSFDPASVEGDLDFVLVNATQGTQYVDPAFDKYAQQIQSIPLRGAIHIFDGNQPWQDQADKFLATVKDKGFQFYILYLDSGNVRSSTAAADNAEQWLEYVDNQVEQRVVLGARGVTLESPGFNPSSLRKWPLFIVSYPATDPDIDADPGLPPGFTEWKIWNYTDHGIARTFGVVGGLINLHVYNGTPEEMGQWLGLNAFSVLDLETGKVSHLSQAVRINTPNSLEFSPDSTYLAAAGDGSVFLLDATTGEEISTLNLGGRTVHSLNFTTDSQQLVIGTDDGIVLLWDLSLLRSAAELDTAIKAACSEVQQNFTPAQWTQYYGSDAAYEVTCPSAPVP